MIVKCKCPYCGRELVSFEGNTREARTKHLEFKDIVTGEVLSSMEFSEPRTVAIERKNFTFKCKECNIEIGITELEDEENKKWSRKF